MLSGAMPSNIAPLVLSINFECALALQIYPDALGTYQLGTDTAF
jgi:hypothetical protein